MLDVQSVLVLPSPLNVISFQGMVKIIPLPYSVAFETLAKV